MKKKDNYSPVSIIQNYADYYNKHKSPEVRMKFAFRWFGHVKIGPTAIIMSSESNTNVILVQKMNSTNRSNPSSNKQDSIIVNIIIFMLNSMELDQMPSYSVADQT